MSALSPDAILRKVWEGRIPLEILLSPSESRTYDQTDPYIVSYPRVSYLPLLLPKLLAFFSSSLIQPEAQPHQGWFSFEGVPLRWHYPLGLLYDLYAGADPVTSRSSGHSQALHLSEQAPEDEHESRNRLPWRLTVHFADWPEQELVRLDADGEVMHDAYVNTVKEADFVRNGSGKAIMSLSKDDSLGMWQAVKDHDFASYKRITHTLHNYLALPLRNIPLRIFLPSPSDSDSPTLKVLQSPFPPNIRTTSTPQTTEEQPLAQTMGTALHSLLPSLFPSRRFPILAKPVLHGAVVPMTAPLEDVLRCAIYADGWLSVVVKMM